jgi:hypothetical protein
MLGHVGQGLPGEGGDPVGVGPVVGQLGAEQPDRRRNLGHHAAIGRDLRFPPLLPMVVDGTLGVVQEALDLLQVAQVELHQALGQAQHGPRPHHLVGEQL